MLPEKEENPIFNLEEVTLNVDSLMNLIKMHKRPAVHPQKRFQTHKTRTCIKVFRQETTGRVYTHF